MTATATLSAAIYARRSSELQREVSTTDQVRRCREYAQRMGWQVPEEHIYLDEEISGALTESRPGYQAMLAAARKRAFDVLIADEQSRLTRDEAEAPKLVQRLTFCGVGLVALANGLDTINNPKAAKALVAVAGIASALERDMNAERQRRAFSGYIKRGMHAGGAVYGYRSREVKERQPGDAEGTGRIVGHELAIHEGEAEVVRRIFRLYAEGKSARQIAGVLNAEGVPPPGTRWRNRTTRTKRTWAHSAISGSRKRGLGILNNSKYVGRLVWNRTTWPRDPERDGKQVRRELPRDQWVTQDVPGLRIVPQDLWDAAKARQRQRSRQRRRVVTVPRAPRLLSGLLVCGRCGARYELRGSRT